MLDVEIPTRMHTDVGTVVTALLMDIFVARIAYELFGWIGVITVIVIYLIGTVINVIAILHLRRKLLEEK